MRILIAFTALSLLATGVAGQTNWISGIINASNLSGCCDADLDLTVLGSGIPPFTFQWSNGSTTQNINNVCSGTYHVTITDAIGATGYGVEQVQTTSGPYYTGYFSDDDVCTNEGWVAINIAQGTPPLYYQWSNGTTDSYASGLMLGDKLYCTVTDAVGCSTVTQSVRVGAYFNPIHITPFSGLMVQNTLCHNIPQTLTAYSDDANYSWQWSTGQTSATISINNFGTYAVTATDSSGCQARNSVTLTPISHFTQLAGSILSNSCLSSVTVLSPSVSAENYWWSNGSTSSSISVTNPGLYDVTVQTAGNCFFKGTANVGCNPPLSLLPNQITSTTVKLNWSWEACATKYKVRLKNMATGLISFYEYNHPTVYTTLSNLSASTLYKVQMRLQCSSDASTISQWSSPIYFTTLGSTASLCIPPTNPSASTTSNSTATINWTSISGANGYQLRYRINGTTTWTPIVINNGLATNTNITSLQANTTYQYQLRTKCSVSPLTWSNYSSIQTFTTPLRLGEDETQITTDVYPNPSTGVFTVNINSTQTSNATVDIFSIDGKLLQTQNAMVESGANALQVNGSNWSAGVYLLKISCGDIVCYKKVVLQ